MTTRNSFKNKVKKPLETTLGKAPIQCLKEESFEDLSHIRKPIDTSIFGLGQVLSLIHTATDEVKNYITYECNILYECKVCRSIFRSLANFILHKRKYCQEKYSIFQNYKANETYDDLKFCENDENNKDDNNSKTVKEKHSKSLSNVLDTLLNKQQSVFLTQTILNGNSNNESDLPENSDKCGVLVLEKIKGCDNALFQTKNDKGHLNTDLMKSEVMEIHSILDNDEAILGPDGKILTTSSQKTNNSHFPKKDITCTICNQKFSTKKTLSCHIKYKHNKNRLVYPCPECKDTLSNTWCVFRHLIKVHRKTPSEIKKLRDVIHSSAIIKDQETNLANSNDKGDEKFKKEETESQHNQQWMEDFESANDLQMCGGCGRRFERKAALHSHSQICLKRIALCNSIKENSSKHVTGEEERSSKDKPKSNPNNNNNTTSSSSSSSSSASTTTIAKGSERRKPLVLRRNCKSSSKDRSDYCVNHKDKDDGVITISDDEPDEDRKREQIETQVKKEPEEDRDLKKNDIEDSKTLTVANKEPKMSELPVEIMKEINSKIAEVIDHIKRKRLSAEDYDSGPEMALSKNEPTPSGRSIKLEDDDCVIIDNDEQQQQQEDPVDCKTVLEVILGPSSATKKPKLEDLNATDVNSSTPFTKKCKEENEDVSSPSSSDSDVSSPPFEAFNKLESDDSNDSARSAPEGDKLKSEKLKVIEDNFLSSKRPVRSRTSTLRNDFLYDAVQVKSKTIRHNREISINNNNNNNNNNNKKKTHK
ncbi:myb-like protein X [Agrilus planipennis]|uniref:Myb-like protein X n=1 Tax=Agrilus planipennis TaxID=224129 RepID=A0A1W4XI90_AGRPL|nr:myb-like protein X [Agrilus planipennis]XP_018332087.1 myb-like protein X [Agrilus planipennis]XP_018332088.1 myb-like protein X [Agrilus planipennis]XP_018332089.1 myb-like protein X [Agrilus planipennis]XP_018332090.1 myb-like protein X [Agrilus planipennis]